LRAAASIDAPENNTREPKRMKCANQNNASRSRSTSLFHHLTITFAAKRHQRHMADGSLTRNVGIWMGLSQQHISSKQKQCAEKKRQSYENITERSSSQKAHWHANV